MEKTPYLLTLALTKFLLEFINQPIRSGGQSAFIVPHEFLRELFRVFIRKFLLETTFRMCYAASALVAEGLRIRGDWVGAFCAYFL
jgi:hypothetical protein